MTIAYEFGESLYLNITNRCSNACDFCVRGDKSGGDVVTSGELWLEREPETAEVMEAIRARDMKKYPEVVFCGYGEPFERFDDCAEIAGFIKSEYGSKIRVNTNGQGCLIAGRDITPEMAGLFDTVSISLNAKNAEEYQALCHSEFGSAAFDALVKFAEKCVEKGIETVFTVVDTIAESDIEECRRIAEGCGAGFRVRTLI